MIKKITTLFIIGRKLALSEVLNIVSKVHKIPLSIKIFFSLLGLFGKKNFNQDLNEEETLQIFGVNGCYIYKTWTVLSNKT